MFTVRGNLTQTNSLYTRCESGSKPTVKAVDIPENLCVSFSFVRKR
jgi:hypothetical protein